MLFIKKRTVLKMQKNFGIMTTENSFHLVELLNIKICECKKHNYTIS